MERNFCIGFLRFRSGCAFGAFALFSRCLFGIFYNLWHLSHSKDHIQERLQVFYQGAGCVNGNLEFQKCKNPAHSSVRDFILVKPFVIEIQFQFSVFAGLGIPFVMSDTAIDGFFFFVYSHEFICIEPFEVGPD